MRFTAFVAATAFSSAVLAASGTTALNKQTIHIPLTFDDREA